MERVSSCVGGNQKIYDPDHYKVVFMSSAPIGVPFLEKLHNDPRFEVIWIVTMSDKPSGRGLKMKPNIIKSESLGLWINEKNIKTPRSLKLSSKKYKSDAEEMKQRLEDMKPDFIVVIAYGKIIPQHILDIPIFGPINVHGSILPEYRGASPIQSVFLDKKQETGITIMKMFAELDTGDMIDTIRFPLRLNDTALDCIHKMQEVWPRFLAKTLEDYAKGRLIDKPQDHSKATYCTKIEKEQWEIDPFHDSLEEIFAKYKGYYLWPKIHFAAPSKRKNHDKLITIDTIICDKKLFEKNKEKPLIEWEEINPAVQTLKLKPEWKKAIEREAFVNGYIKQMNK